MQPSKVRLAFGKFKRKSTFEGRKTPKKTSGSSIYAFERASSHSGKYKNGPLLANLSSFNQQNLTVGEYSTYVDVDAKSLDLFGSFKRSQRHELFSQRVTFVRNETVEMNNKLKGVLQGESAKSLCFDGRPGSGKSMLLTQTQALALQHGFIVLPISEPRKLISGENDTVFDSKNDIFLQPMWTRSWLKATARGNAQNLSKIQTGSTNLLDLVNNKKIDFATFFDRLQESKAPILFSMDDVNVFCEQPYSANRDIENQQIYHGKLQVPNTFLKFLSGQRKFTGPSLIVASTSSGYQLNDTIPIGLGIKPVVPYASLDAFDPDLASAFNTAEQLVVSPLSYGETKASLDFYKSADVVADEVTETYVNQKYFLSGNGNPRQLLESIVGHI